MMDNTFIRVYDKKEFGNNTPNNNKYVITYDNNIFYDSSVCRSSFRATVNWNITRI